MGDFFSASQFGADQPVRVGARSHDAGFELSVSNGGTPIPADKLARLFQPFSRDSDSALQPGLGLGLYIAAEIARAHRGTLSVTSTAAGTCFAFHLLPPAVLPADLRGIAAVPGARAPVPG